MAAIGALSLSSCTDGGFQGTAPAGLKNEAMLLDSRVYRLGVGDKLKITIYGEPDLSGQMDVNAIGNLPMPLIGDVPAKGRSIGEIRDAVAGRLADGYLKNPKVSVEVINYRAIYVHGEVRNAGEFAFKTGLKFRDAIATAGGFTYRANVAYLLVSRDGSGEMKISMPSDLPVLPGDNIRVPERFF